MKLADYLKKHGITQMAFAKRARVERGAVGRWLNGERTPRPSMARKIVRLTDGSVTLADIYGHAR